MLKINTNTYVENFLKTLVFKSGGKWIIFITLHAKFRLKRVMLRFLGNTEAKLDAKGRVFIPAAFRKLLQQSGNTDLILRKDIFQNCLVLYPTEVWNDEVSKLRSRLNRWGKQEQHIFRQFLIDAERLEMDASGRILIPKRYQELVNIDSEVRFLGVDNTIEIWSRGELELTILPAEDFGIELERLMNNEYDK